MCSVVWCHAAESLDVPCFRGDISFSTALRSAEKMAAVSACPQQKPRVNPERLARLAVVLTENSGIKQQARRIEEQGT